MCYSLLSWELPKACRQNLESLSVSLCCSVFSSKKSVFEEERVSITHEISLLGKS